MTRFQISFTWKKKNERTRADLYRNAASVCFCHDYLPFLPRFGLLNAFNSL